MTNIESILSHNGSSNRIIVIDLDGTLVNTDMLVENLFLFLRKYPLRIFEVILWLFSGKAYFKKCLADAVIPDVFQLPYNKEVLLWAEQQKADGASLVLATASDLRIAKRVATHLGIFDEVIGTEDINLSSRHKQEALVKRYGKKGFEYVGNSTVDLTVWKAASVIHIANPGWGLVTAAREIGDIGTIFKRRTGYVYDLLISLRLHQWVKNLLIFVPLLASHRFMEVQLLLKGMFAFIAFGICASSVYLLNDLFDLPDDRQHPTKRNRPLAAGKLPILHGLLLIPIMLFVAFGLAIWTLPVQFTGMLAIYYAFTLTYTLWFKRVVMLDVITLAILYTIRVIAGAAAMSLTATFWILAFCIFIFLSLAFLKRYTELHDAKQDNEIDTFSARGYYPADFELLASLGGASGYISVLVLALYINEAATGVLYNSPKWMWIACPLLLFWLSRVWLLAHRGQMHDDPIVFALSDKISLYIGLAFIFVFSLASF